MANANKHTGIVTISIGGKSAKLVYDYEAIAAFQAEFGKKADINDFGLTQLVDTLLIGLKRHNPDITKEEIFKASPPVAQMSDWLVKAFLYAQHGPEEGGKIIDEAEALGRDLQKKTGGRPVKKTPKKTKSPKA